MKANIDLSDVYTASYTTFIEAFRRQVEVLASSIFCEFFVDDVGRVRVFDDAPAAAPSVTAYQFRKKLFSYFEDKDELSVNSDGRRVVAPALRERAKTLAEVTEANRPILGEFVDVLERFRSVAGAVFDGKDALATLDERYGMRTSLKLWEYMMLGWPAKAPCNAMMARVLIAKLTEAPGAVVFEGGAGLGVVLRSALADARFASVAKNLERYDYTDISALLLDLGKQWLRANAPEVFRRTRFERVDLGELAAAGGGTFAKPSSVDLIVLEHVLYDVRDLDLTLRTFRSMLKPGGWLAFTMSFRARPRVFFANEILQSMLHTYNKAKLDPPRRENVGYLTLREWELSLREAGFSKWEVHPSPEHFDKWPFGGIVAYV